MRPGTVATISLAALILGTPAPSPAEVRVCATTSTLGSLAREIGGDAVEVTVFARGTEDAHFVEPRPSFVKRLSRADLLVSNGMELEVGWLPQLVRGSRNGRILPGAPGHLDASAGISALEVPATADRSAGDVHGAGNPHYLLDPLNGVTVARVLAQRLSTLDPEHAAAYAARLATFERRIHVALVGESLASRYDVARLALLAEHAKLVSFLESEGQAHLLGGWLGLLRGSRPLDVVADHNLWPYFARRFGVRVVGLLEPKPGLPPTTTHLRELVERMRGLGVRRILSSAYYNPAHARFVASHTGARIVEMAHDVGAVRGVEDYLGMIDHDVRALVADGNAR